MSSEKDKNLVKVWLEQISQAEKREKDYREDGKKVVAIYEGDKKDEVPYNILYSNVETLSPAVYNATPRPVVSRRFKDADPIGLEVGQVLTKTLEFLADPGEMQYPTFNSLMDSAVLEGLVTGRGVTQFRYDAAKMASGDLYEMVCGTAVPWNRFLHGYAKKWEDVPWVAYDHFMTREELKDNFGAEAANIKMSPALPDEEKADGKRATEGIPDLAHVYEIWDKGTKKVIFLCENHEKPLKVVDDPLRLTGFFNCPEPLAFFRKIKDLVPLPLYNQYANQARELNEVTRRIDKITRAMKVRGMYDSRVDGIDKVLESGDGEMTPATNLTQIGDNAILERAIWMMPIEKLSAALQGLYLQRQQIKAVIYEITGIADILRGSSVASETATAQNIKDKWGSLRLKRFQREVGRYCKDAYRIMAEIAAKHFKQKTFAAMTGMKYLTNAEKAGLQNQVQAYKQIAAQAQATGQQPPPPPPGADKVMAQLQKPTWEELLATMQNDLLRAYRLDIETNSTVDVEATEDKQNLAELLNAISQFMNGMMPLVESGAMPAGAAQQMLLGITRRFRFGDEFEGALEQIGQAPPKSDPKAQAAQAQAENDKQRLAMEGEKAKAQFGLDQARMQQDFQIKQAELQQTLQLEREKMQGELAIEQQRMQAEMVLKQKELQQSAMIEAAKIEQAREASRTEVEGSVAQARITQDAETTRATAEALRTKQAEMRAAAKDQTATISRMEGLVGQLEAAVKAANGDAQRVILEGMTKVLQAANGAKKVVRGSDGLIAGVEPV